MLGDDALERLGRFLDAQGWRDVVLVADANTDEALGQRLGEELAASGHTVRRHVFAERTHLRADDGALGAARRVLGAGRVDVVLAVGSGTLTDIVRWASFSEGHPFCAVPTAASMDGYASTVAALQIDGVKVTRPAHAPAGIFADTAVVAGAPALLARAGVGDLLGKVSASFDWRLGHLVTGEPYCAAIDDALAAVVDACAHAWLEAPGARASVHQLLAGLVHSGVCMTAFGNSRPASGSEHHLSHLWDLFAYTGRRAAARHGAQVGYATTLTTGVQAMALEGLSGALVAVPGALDARAVEVLGGRDPNLVAVAAEKVAAFARYAPGWPPPAGVLAAGEQMLASAAARFATARAALARAGLADAAALELDRDTARLSLRYANRLRSRFTVLDLLEAQGRIEPLAEIVLGPR